MTTDDFESYTFLSVHSFIIPTQYSGEELFIETKISIINVFKILVMIYTWSHLGRAKTEKCQIIFTLYSLLHIM